MKTLLRTGLPLLMLSALLAGCQTMSPTTQAASEEWRLMSLEENFLEFKETQQAQVNGTKQTEAVLKERMMALEEQMAALRNELAESRKNEIAPVMSGPESSEEKPWANIPQPAPAPKPAPKPVPMPAAKPAPAKPTAAKQDTSSAQALYAKGQQLAASEKSEEARTVLDSFIAKYPKSNLMPNALYWKGETYYAQKNYPQAILTFKDVTQRYPRHAKAQDALLKIGMSYKNSGDTDNAVLYLRTLVDEHPNASASALARKILQELPE